MNVKRDDFNLEQELSDIMTRAEGIQRLAIEAEHGAVRPLWGLIEMLARDIRHAAERIDSVPLVRDGAAPATEVIQ